MFIESVAKVAK